ncbi:6809_t:CDS:2, partial [Racocetra fulgida]
PITEMQVIILVSKKYDQCRYSESFTEICIFTGIDLTNMYCNLKLQ